jgi:carbon monoxide dehydrogenase subunit G
MTITYTQHIAAPIERVFAWVDDEEKLRAWMDGLEETIDPEGRGRERRVGTRFRQRIREGGRLVEYEGEVTAYEKPRHIGVRIGNAMFACEVDYRFAPEGQGTRLDYRAEFLYRHWLARVMGALFGWLTWRILKKQIAKLKAVAEAGSA